MTNESNDNLTPDEKARRAKSPDFNAITKEMHRLAKSEHDNAQLTEAWKKGQKTPALQAQAEEVDQDEKPAVDLYDDRNAAQTPETPKQSPKAEEIKSKPSQRGTKHGADLIQERWATFEQSQAKALDGIREMETKRDDAQEKLDEFNEKHGDYLSKSIKQATGGDLRRMEHYKKLQDQQRGLEKSVAGVDKALEQSRDRYQRDHHEFHGDAWSRIRQQGEVMGQQELIKKADSMAQQHSKAQSNYGQKLPAQEEVRHTKSITAQKVEEYARLSGDLAQRAEHDPALQREIAQGRDQVKQIGEDTAQRRAERQDERIPNHKIKQSV